MPTRNTLCRAAGILMLVCLVAMPVWADDTAELKAMAESWATHYNSGNAHAIAAMYADDAVLMPPNAAPASGHEAIEAAVKGVMAELGGTLSITAVDAGSSGNLGYSSGTWALSGDDGSKMDNGKWLIVYKKVQGKWMMSHDAWNSDNPIPE